MRNVLLLVEDDILVCQCVAENLRDEGFEVLEANTVSEAITLLKSETVNILFTDIMLPDGTGWHLAETARNHYPFLQVVYASGGVIQPDATQPDKVSGGFLINKPYDTKTLAKIFHTGRLID